MQKSKATKLAKIINYFANEWQTDLWEAEVSKFSGKEWQIKIKIKNSAYLSELHALMMVISYTITPSVYQRVDENNEIYWKLW